MKSAILSGNKLTCRIIYVVFLFALIAHSVLGQVQIDSFIKVHPLLTDGFLEDPQYIESKIDTTIQGNHVAGAVFRSREHIPVIGNCEEGANVQREISCTEALLSKYLVQHIDSLELEKPDDIYKSISCRITLDYVGAMKKVEVLTPIDEGVKAEIIEAIDFLRKNYVTWTAQSSRTRIRTVYVYTTLDLVEIMRLKKKGR